MEIRVERENGGKEARSEDTLVFLQHCIYNFTRFPKN